VVAYLKVPKSNFWGSGHFSGLLGMAITGKFDPGSDGGTEAALEAYANNLFSICLVCTALASLLFVIFQKISCFNSPAHGDIAPDRPDKFTEGSTGGLLGALCCKNVLNSCCGTTDTYIDTYDDSATVKSMDISEYGGNHKQLPLELDACALATAQFLNSEMNINSLTPAERIKLTENKQAMRAYLISKLVAPRYDVDHDGKIEAEHFKRGHLGADKYHQRQSAMFHLVFNGQISVDTKATKRQQRDAIKRLKRCNKERLKGKDNYDKNMMSSKISISEKETSGVGTELPMDRIDSPKRNSTEKKQKGSEMKRVETKMTHESGLEISEKSSDSDRNLMTSSECQMVPESSTTGTGRIHQKSKISQIKQSRTSSNLKRSTSSSSDSSHETGNLADRRAALDRLRTSLKAKPDSAVGSSIAQYDADVESVDRGRLQKLRSSLQSVEEVRYMPESTEEEDSITEDDDDDMTSDDDLDGDIQESIVLEQGIDINHQSHKIRRSLSDKVKRISETTEISPPKWPSENILTITQ